MELPQVLSFINYKHGARGSETEDRYTILQRWVKVLIGVNENSLHSWVSYI